MNCEQALALISSRIDREILPGENAWLSEHLRDCPSCRATAEAFALQHKDMTEVFKSRRQAVNATAERVNASVAALCGRPTGRRRWPVPRGVLIGVGAGTAWLVAAVLLFSFLQSERGGVSSPPIFVPQPPPAGQPTPMAQSVRLTPRPLPKAVEPAPLQPGQTVTTVAGERRRVTLPDSSAVYLNENTTCSYATNKVVTLQAGTAYFELASNANQPGNNTLAVITEDRSVLSEGSKFAVQVEPKGTQLLAVNGNLTVLDPDQQDPAEITKVLHAGEMCSRRTPPGRGQQPASFACPRLDARPDRG